MINYLKEKEKVEVIEGSAKENTNVNEAFILLIDKMLELGLGNRRSSFREDDDEDEKSQSVKLNNLNVKNEKKAGCCRK